MARKKPQKARVTTAKAAKARKAPAKKAGKALASGAAKKPAKGAAKKARTAAGAKPATAAKKVRAAKAARKAATRAAARKTARKSAVKTAASASPKRRTAPRSSAGRRLIARATQSHEALAKKTVASAKTPTAAKTAKTAKTTKSARKPAKTRAVKTAAAAPPLAVGKTARSRIAVRQTKKLTPSVLRDGARRRVEKPTAPRPEKKSVSPRRPPFRLHALGVRDEHPTDRPAIGALLVAAYGRRDEADAVARARDNDGVLAALVAEYEGEIIGYLALTPATASGGDRALAVARLVAIAVVEPRRGRGVGSVLISAGLEAARSAGVCALVAPSDAAWLERFGFERSDVLASPAYTAELDAEALQGKPGSLTLS